MKASMSFVRMVTIAILALTSAVQSANASEAEKSSIPALPTASDVQDNTSLQARTATTANQFRDAKAAIKNNPAMRQTFATLEEMVEVYTKGRSSSSRAGAIDVADKLRLLSGKGVKQCDEAVLSLAGLLETIKSLHEDSELLYATAKNAAADKVVEITGRLEKKYADFEADLDGRIAELRQKAVSADSDRRTQLENLITAHEEAKTEMLSHRQARPIGIDGTLAVKKLSEQTAAIGQSEVRLRKLIHAMIKVGGELEAYEAELDLLLVGLNAETGALDNPALIIGTIDKKTKSLGAGIRRIATQAGVP